MRWTALASDLEQLFQTPIHAEGGEAIYVAAQPVDIQTLMQRYVDDSNDAARLASDGWLALLDDSGWRREALLRMEWLPGWLALPDDPARQRGPLPPPDWEGDGQITSWLSLQLVLPAATRLYVSFGQPDARWLLIARLSSKLMLAPFVNQLLESNGEAYGLDEVMGGLPSLTRNYQPEWAPAEVFRQGFGRWLEATGNEYQDWQMLAEEIALRQNDPDEAAPLPWPESQAEPLSDEWKQQVLDHYLSIAYEEESDSTTSDGS